MRPASFPNIPLFASSDQDGEFDLDESMDVARHVEELLRRPIDSLDARLSHPLASSPLPEARCPEPWNATLLLENHLQCEEPTSV